MSQKQKIKNPIWQYYYDKCSTDLSKATCKICNKSYSLGSSDPRKQTIFKPAIQYRGTKIGSQIKKK